MCRAGLGLLVGAVLHIPAAAQQPPTPPRRDTTVAVPIPARPDSLRPPTPPDTLRLDSLRRASVLRDSLEAERLRRIAADTIKAPLARAESPPVVEVDGAYHWNRVSLFATGAQTLTELLDRIPGYTAFRTGWIASPQTAAFMGDFARVRIFFDGLELDPIDPRNGGMHDLSFIQLYQLDDLRVERGAGELRVYLRSWSDRLTIPQTRVDVQTGDLETNVYRGYFSKRFRNGVATQFAASQYSTSDNRNVGDAANLSIFTRVGWAKKRWSLDLTALRTGRDRDAQLRADVDRADLPPLDATYTEAYVRAAYGDPEAGPWLQLIAGSLAFRETGNVTDSVPDPADTTRILDPDTTRSVAQYVLAGGLTRWGLRLSGTGRYRVFAGQRLLTPSVRASFARGPVVATVLAERAIEDSLFRVDAIARFSPFSFLYVAGAASRFSAIETGVSPTITSVRGEVGVKLGRLWASGGLITRDTAVLIAPVVFDTGFTSVVSGMTNGTFVTLRGMFWSSVGLDVSATRWPEQGIYRPQYQARSTMYVNTSMPNRFPSGNLNIYAGITHEYRSQATFPVNGEAALTSDQYRTLSFHLEIKLLTARLYYQFRNFLGEQHQQVPGYPMPRQMSFYGLRWEFRN